MTGMRNLILLAILFGSLILPASGQSKDISKAEYDKAFNFAVSETNAQFPFLFKVSVNDYENGHVKATQDSIDERETAGAERMSEIVTEGDKRTTSFEVRTGFSQVYCSSDGKSWTGPQRYECGGPRRLYGPRNPESASYGVTTAKLGDKNVRLYREYVVYPAAQNSRRGFSEKISTIDSRGYFIKIEGTEGLLDPQEITLTRLQTWDLTTKFPPVIAPK